MVLMPLLSLLLTLLVILTMHVFLARLTVIPIKSLSICFRVNRAKKSGMVNITSSVNSRERSGINTILHELNPLFTINVTMRDIKRSEERRVGKESSKKRKWYSIGIKAYYMTLLKEV